MLGASALLLQFGERYGLVVPRFPAGEGIGEEDAGALATVVCERSVEVMHRESDLEVGDDERCERDLETEYALGGGLLDAGACESAEAMVLEVGGDASQHLGEVRTGAAAGIEHIDVLGGQTIGDAEVVFEGAVDAGDHVAHHLVGGVPDAKLLTEVGIESLQERLVEVLYGLALTEAVEERLAVHAVQGGGGPVEHFDETQRLQLAGVGELQEERPEHGGREDARQLHAS